MAAAAVEDPAADKKPTAVEPVASVTDRDQEAADHPDPDPYF